MIDYLIIGSHRGGLCSVYDYIIQHPRIAPALTACSHYFDLNHDRGLDWYRSQFPLLALHGSSDGHLIGEAAPLALSHPLAASRLAALSPTVRLLVFLRDPVDRAYSHWRLAVREYREQFTFNNGLRVEPKRIERAVRLFGSDPDRRWRELMPYAYVSHGHYARLLRPWLDTFPRDRFMFLTSETFFAKPLETIQQAYSFLGLPPFMP
jgi:hypothetical protein